MRDFVDLTESSKSPLQMCRAQSGGWGLACIKWGTYFQRIYKKPGMSEASHLPKTLPNILKGSDS